MKSLKQILNNKDKVAKNKYVSREFQDYGLGIAESLGDMAHKSLYIKLAQTHDRALLETCRSFVIDSTARNKGALFMWKLKKMTHDKNTRLTHEEN